MSVLGGHKPVPPPGWSHVRSPAYWQLSGPGFAFAQSIASVPDAQRPMPHGTRSSQSPLRTHGQDRPNREQSAKSVPSGQRPVPA